MPKGIVEFMGISERVDLVQARVRAVKKLDAREKKSGVADMFAVSTVEEASDGRSSPDEVDVFWRRYLASGDRRITTTEFADILEATNWLPRDLRALLLRLVKAGVVRNLDADASKRRSRPLHFENAGERLQLV
jgi:hypothetical protein